MSLNRDCTALHFIIINMNLTMTMGTFVFVSQRSTKFPFPEMVSFLEKVSLLLMFLRNTKINFMEYCLKISLLQDQSLGLECK